MMHGYDKDAAVAFITRCIRKADHPELAEDIPALVPQMIDADMAYMHEAGVLDDDGYAGTLSNHWRRRTRSTPNRRSSLPRWWTTTSMPSRCFWNRRVWWSTTNKQNHNTQNGSAPRRLAGADPLFCTLFNTFNRDFLT